MKFSAQEEYGLRCLLRIGKCSSPNGLTIPEISESEKLSTANVGKLLRALRLGGYIESSRGQHGGYRLIRPSEEIIIGEVLADLGGRLFDPSFCDTHSGTSKVCTHTIDCSIRSLWKTVQSSVDSVLSRTTLADLLGTETQVESLVKTYAANGET